MPTASAFNADYDNGGQWVWFPDKDEAFLPAQVVSTAGNKATLDVVGRGRQHVDASSLGSYEPCGTMLNANVSNLVDLDMFSEGTILHHVAKRFAQDVIYTFVGSILVACNPFQRFDIYGVDAIERFKAFAEAGDTPDPHTYAIASQSFTKLRSNRHSQSVLISGESGAGKTETTKQVLQFLAHVAGSKGEMGIAEQILQSNPVLEAFGNAKTLRNNNSSRFGKWMKIDFDDHTMKIHGCRVINYLLEKSRVVFQNSGERNYHVFYQLLRGATPAEQNQFRFNAPETYPFLASSGCTSIPGVDDEAEMADMRRALDILNFTPEEQAAMVKLLAAILSMGSINFEPKTSEDDSQVTGDTEEHLGLVAEHLGLSAAGLASSFTIRFETMGGGGRRGSTVAIQLSVQKAVQNRDAFAKEVYSKMFDWLVTKVNESLFKGPTSVHFGVLDIFGFETFKVNSFEQLCINYTNEKLQSHFNEVIFAEEMKMYEAEEVPHDSIVFPDNSMCVSLIDKRPIGILALLDEQCSLGKGTDEAFLKAIDKNFTKQAKTHNPYYWKHPANHICFVVKHFAGDVEYNVTNFLEKNKDTISSTLVSTAMKSQEPLVPLLFAEKPEPPSETPGNSRKKKGKKTLGGKFKGDLDGLMHALYDTEPSFIRCIKSNHDKVPRKFTPPLALQQLKNGGLFEAIRIRRAGYAYRIPHDSFGKQFAILYPELQIRVREDKHANMREISTEILTRFAATHGPNFTNASFAIGLTKVFLKTGQEQSQLEQARKKAISHLILAMQAICRGWVTRRLLWLEKHAEEEAERKRLAELERQRRLEEQREAAEAAAATLLQSKARAFTAKMQFRRLGCIRVLWQAEQTEDIATLEQALFKQRQDMPDRELPAWARVKVAMAEGKLKLWKEREAILELVNEAAISLDVDALDLNLLRAEQLGLGEHPIVQQATVDLDDIKEKRRVMNRLMAFLKDDGAVWGVPELLDEARRLQVDETFLDKVEDVYEQVAPKLEARNSVRRAVEYVHHQGLLDGLQEIRELCENDEYGPFGQQEVQAGEQMLKMLEFEDELYAGEFPPDRERLNDELIALCQRVHQSRDRELKREAESDLMAVLRNGRAMEGCIRAYKWRSVYATWLYFKGNNGLVQEEDEFTPNENISDMFSEAADEEASFFGMKPEYARYRYNIHVAAANAAFVPTSMRHKLKKTRTVVKSPQASRTLAESRHQQVMQATRSARKTPVYYQRKKPSQDELPKHLQTLEESRAVVERKRKEVAQTSARLRPKRKSRWK